MIQVRGVPRKQGGPNSSVGGTVEGTNMKPTFVVHLAGGHVGQGTRRNEGIMADMYRHVSIKS